MFSASNSDDNRERPVAETMLRSLQDRGVQYVFSNFGTDHTPLLEAAAGIREQGEADALPEFIVCPHEFVALSAAHGYAAQTGEPQAVLVHVDVGTQNLGAAMHNAHRAEAPVFVLSGLAPVSHRGYPGSRDHPVHYVQDVFDQTGIVREYCRWTEEYRPPADPDEVVRRGLERSLATPPGPVYLSATREALEAPTPETQDDAASVRTVRPESASEQHIEALAERIKAADAPLVVTSKSVGGPGNHELAPLVSFAEAAGVGVVEHSPVELCFPRDHPLHVGFDPGAVVDLADLLLLVETDVPWIPARTTVPDDVPVVQVDTDATKSQFPSWPFRVDESIEADPSSTLAALADRLSDSTETQWTSVAEQRRDTAREALEADRSDGRLTAAVLSDAIAEHVDEDTVLLDDATTSRPALLTHVPLSEPGSYLWKGGAGLGWSVGAGIGAKLASPASRVIATVGDGGYLFSNPASCALVANSADAPTLTVIYNNSGWEAVREAVAQQHPEGSSVDAGVPERVYGEPVDLSRIASVADAHTEQVDDVERLPEALDEAVQAVDAGRPAVLNVKIVN